MRRFPAVFALSLLIVLCNPMADVGTRAVGQPPSLTLYIPEVDGSTVTVNGVTLPGAPDVRVTFIHWDWGDGYSEDRWFPASHTYGRGGTYTIRVTSHQSDGLSTAKSATVTLYETRTVGSFDFKTEIFGKRSSISVRVVSINTGTGEVTLSGVDTRSPKVPFTWDWGDGQVATGWFPQSHTYLDRTRNYLVKVTSHYSGRETGSAEALVRFIRPAIVPMPLSPHVAVLVPNHPVNLISRMPGYGIPSLSYFGDAFFVVTDRAIVEYVLTAAASIQKDCANDNVYLIDGGFRQVVLRDPQFGGMYSLWYTSPVALAAGDSMWQGSIPWSSIFHEMGHDMTLNSPSDYFYGGKTDGNGNAIFSESMAQIFQHATAYELINSAGTYGLGNDIVFEIKQSAIQSMWIVRGAYEDYVSSGMDFSSWDDPAIPTDETFGTFMTVAHSFFVHAEDSGLGYRVPLKRMMNLLQEFGERDRERYSQYSNTPAAETFRATLMVAALSYGFGEDLRTEFRGLRFPINDEVYNELIQRAGTTRMSRSTTTTGTDVAQSSTRTLEAEWGTYYAMPFVVIGAVVAVIVIVAALLLTRRRRKNQRWLPK